MRFSTEKLQVWCIHFLIFFSIAIFFSSSNIKFTKKKLKQNLTFCVNSVVQLFFKENILQVFTRKTNKNRSFGTILLWPHGNCDKRKLQMSKRQR